MTSLDDLPLETGHRDSARKAPSAPSSPGPRVALLVVLVAGVLAAGAWFYVSRQRAATAAPPGEGTAGAQAAQPVADPPPVAPELPPLPQMDPFVRELFATLDPQAELVKWLATDDLVGAIATAIDRLSQGQSPARDLAVLRPAQGFAVARRDGLVRPTPSSYTRYAPLVDAVASVDPARLAAAFTTLRPRLAEAYASQGHPAGGFDDAVRRAIAVVATTPDLPHDAALVPGVGGYAYADPAFERLPPAQKHLIRMGPDHARRVREAARRFGDALAAAGTAR
jgi:hypothetical protein